MRNLDLMFNQAGLTEDDKKNLATKMCYFFVLIAVCFLFASGSYAFTAPAVGDPGYAAYKILVNDIIQGPIGVAGGTLLVLIGLGTVNQSWVKGGLSIACGAGIVSVDEITTSFGMMLPL